MTVLVTGAAGELGIGLLRNLVSSKLYGLDLGSPKHWIPDSVTWIKGDITDSDFINRVFKEIRPTTVYHFAALLSTAAEKNPLLAQKVNVEGSLNILNAARDLSTTKNPVKVIFPSTIAVYGTSSIEPTEEDKFENPITMYGANKLYIEKLGVYYSRFFQLTDQNPEKPLIDFRAVRFPGLISADTLPTGGTSDYAAEMVHAAARGEHYTCFVKPETVLPFMVMPDALRAIIELSEASTINEERVFNVGAFSVSARQIEEKVRSFFPKFEVEYVPNPGRLQIVDSWPRYLADGRAKRVWGWKAKYDFDRAFDEYLISGLLKKAGNE